MNQLEHPQEEITHALLVHPDLLVHQGEAVEVEAEVGAEKDQDQEIELWEEEEKGVEVEVTAEAEAQALRLSKQNLQEFLEYLD